MRIFWFHWFYIYFCLTLFTVEFGYHNFRSCYNLISEVQVLYKWLKTAISEFMRDNQAGRHERDKTSVENQAWKTSISTLHCRFIICVLWIWLLGLCTARKAITNSAFRGSSKVWNRTTKNSELTLGFMPKDAFYPSLVRTQDKMSGRV